MHVEYGVLSDGCWLLSSLDVMQGKRLFMPLRILLTGSMHGPDVGAILALVDRASSSGCISEEVDIVTLLERVKLLQALDLGAVTNKAEPAMT